MEFPTEEARQKYLKEHPGADKANHTVKKSEPHDMSDARGHIKDDMDKMPTSFMDKDRAYNHPAIKGLAKQLAKMPQAQLEKQFEHVTRLRRKMDDDAINAGDHKGPDDSPREKQRAQMESLWRAYNLARQVVRDEGLKHPPEVSRGKYLSRSELNKRKPLHRETVEKLKGWAGVGASDPVRKVIKEEAQDQYVRKDLVDKAVTHLEGLAKSPRHKEEKDEIEALVKELKGNGGKQAMDKAARLEELRAKMGWCSD